MPGGYQLAVTLTFDAVGVDRPVCVAQMILRYLGPVNSTDSTSNDLGGNGAR
ncbi:hypothetical protein GS432_20085 [Rhodococcus hoagii]|nr:hypothetical protein [Prescottella equi]